MCRKIFQTLMFLTIATLGHSQSIDETVAFLNANLKSYALNNLNIENGYAVGVAKKNNQTIIGISSLTRMDNLQVGSFYEIEPKSVQMIGQKIFDSGAKWIFLTSHYGGFKEYSIESGKINYNSLTTPANMESI